MSTAELAGPPAVASRPGRAAVWSRFWRSDLALTFRRRRTIALLCVLAAVPIAIGVALRVSDPAAATGDGAGAALYAQVAHNGVFLVVAALMSMLFLILPLVVSVVAGDSIAGEAHGGTLRYLLVAPVGRGRLLLTKYLTVVAFCVVGMAVVVAAGLLTGFVLFPIGRVTLLSGASVPLSTGLVRVTLIGLYLVAGLAALGAIGLAVSTFTEVPIGAIAGTLVASVAGTIMDQLPQLHAIQPYLLPHWWAKYTALLRMPVDTGQLEHGLLVFAAYAGVFFAIAWARFTGKDVTN